MSEETIKKARFTGKGIFISILSILIAGIIIWGTLILAEKVPDIGTETTGHSIQMPSALASILQAVLGIKGDITIETLILGLAIFAIMAFAITDILLLFASFSSTTSWVIGIAFGAIAGVTGLTAGIAQILGFTAGIGAIGVALIILGAILSAVTLNLGIGGYARRWRLERQVEIEAMKSEKGTAKVTSAIRGLKEVTRELEEGESI